MRSYRATTDISWIGKERKIIWRKSSSLSWTQNMIGNSRCSETQLQERSAVNPTCERILEKRVRALDCSTRCFEHLVVSNRSGLLPYDVFQMGWFNFKVCRCCQSFAKKFPSDHHINEISWNLRQVTAPMRLQSLRGNDGAESKHLRQHLAADEVSSHHWLSMVRCWLMGSFALAFHHHRSVFLVGGLVWKGILF